MTTAARSLAFDIGFNVNDQSLVNTNSALDDMKVGVVDTDHSIANMGAVTDTTGNRMTSAFSSVNSRISEGVSLLSQYKYHITGVFAAATGVIWNTTREAAKNEDAINKFESVFGEFADTTLDWANDYSDAIGRSTADTVDWLNSFQDVIVPMGFARDEASNLSQDMVQLAADLGSFNNIETEQAASRLQSALVGNTDAVRSLGIQFSAADVEQRAYKEGIVSTGEELSNQQRALATMSIFYDRSADALGDATRTAGDFNNQTQRTGGIFRDLRIRIGNFFLPTMGRVLYQFNNLFSTLSNNEPLANITGLFVGLTAATSLTALTITGARKAFLLASPVFLKFGGIAIGVAGVLAGLYLVVEDLIIGFRGGESALFDLGDRFLDFVGINYDMQDIVQGTVDYLGMLGNSLRSFGSGAVSFFGWVLTPFEKTGNQMISFAGYFTDGITGIFKGFVQRKFAMVQTVAGLLQGLLTGDFDLFRTGVDNWLGGLETSLSGFTDIFTAPMNFVADRFIEFQSFLGNLSPMQSLGVAIQSGLDTLPGPIRGAANRVLDWMGGDDEATEPVSPQPVDTPSFDTGNFDMAEVEAVNEYNMRQVRETSQSISRSESTTVNDVDVGGVTINAGDIQKPEDLRRVANKEFKKILKQELASLTT
ncbi:hypothetical protein MWH28_12200 [Natroniella sulfidigena]|uniref:hypothetical protein n=1 Tax=Natroniella sulfidigena TaxID=723921 RepID=UPI00200A20AC|nr:hypothetical protein [Natroniella sulfidigena]MCK8818118.1 hypothetical protein [Natroniella sulfidigena]